MGSLGWSSRGWRAIGVFDEASYLEIDRVGRGEALGRQARSAVFAVRETYLRLRAGEGYAYDWDDLAGPRSAGAAGPDHRSSGKTSVILVCTEGRVGPPAMTVRARRGASREGSGLCG
jgi:hypothetical protein